MDVVDIRGDKIDAEYSRIREDCRGIVIDNGKILLVYDVNTDQWFIPGGGLECGETLEACCIRELQEETGCIVKLSKPYLTINEYYEEWLFKSHYFICEIIGKTKRKLTKMERVVGLEHRWIPLVEALEIFSKHQDYVDANEMKRGAYLREYKALCSFIKIRGNNK